MFYTKISNEVQIATLQDTLYVTSPNVGDFQNRDSVHYCRSFFFSRTSFVEVEELWYQITGRYPLCYVGLYIKGQNEFCGIRMLTAIVGGGVREDSDIRFARRLAS